ncbi:MocR-like transcription factor YczR [Fodinicola feengrottensis]|uniref:MocR-like transcription factor YczR n=1 Tax=Fodinicola feengrottensis TaxID=435914 RepID=UPI0013D5B487|nr:PLP-dependent aminotransferase family protein [Fodinicola feengrottensis]
MVTGIMLSKVLGEWWHRGDGPAHRQLADRVQVLVLDGRLPLRTRLPAERELATTLGLSRGTVTTAYDALRESGFIASKRGAGSWVELPARPRQVTPSWSLTPYGGSVADTFIDMAHAAPGAPTGDLYPAVQAAVARLPEFLPAHGYYGNGIEMLRGAIADRYTRRGLPTRADQIMVCAGAQHGISLVLAAFVAAGDRIVVEHPAYPAIFDAIRQVSCRAVPVALTALGWDLDLVEATVAQTAPRLAYFIPDFHNPTGLCMDAEQRIRLARLAHRRQTLLLIDESMVELGLEHPAPPPVGAGLPLSVQENLVHLGSTSKTFWGGLRVGWIRGQSELLHRLAVVRAGTDLASPVLEQLITVELLEQADDILPRRNKELADRRDQLTALVRERFPGWSVPHPPGGLNLWIDLAAPVSSMLALTAGRYGLQLAAGPRFGVDGAFETRLRLPYTLNAEDTVTAVDRLAAAASGMGARPRAPSVAPATGLV